MLNWKNKSQLRLMYFLYIYSIDVMVNFLFYQNWFILKAQGE